MSRRIRTVLAMVLLQVAPTSAADLARHDLTHATGNVVHRRVENVRLRARCTGSDDPVVLRCLPQIELPALSQRGEQQMAILRRPRGRPYQQVFTWGD